MSQLRDFLSLLDKNEELLVIDYPVAPYLELAEIHRRVIETQGPALLFTNVKGSDFPVVSNLFGTKKRVELAFSSFTPQNMKELISALETFSPSFENFYKNKTYLKKIFSLGNKKVFFSKIKKNQISPVNLNKIPFITSWPQDGGAFLTLPLVYTESLKTKIPNLGMYRIQRFDNCTTGLHFQIQKGAGMHFHEAEEQNVNLPVNIFLGGSPFLILASILPLPENISELLFVNFFEGKKTKYTSSKYNSYPILDECEFAFIGYAPYKQREPEGPFGDHYGYYSLKHDFPIFKCQAIYHKKNAIFPCTIVGKPRQEDFYLGEYIQELFNPLIKFLLPGIKDIKSYGETGFHSLAAAIVKERYYKESLVQALRILGEGQLSLTKFLMITNVEVDLNNFQNLLKVILERFNPERDLIILDNTSQDTLDYTGTSLNKGSKGILFGIGEPIRELPINYNEAVPLNINKIAPFVPGCLVLEPVATTNIEELIPELLSFKSFSSWPFLILVDDLEEALKSTTNFLWNVFTKFNPGLDIHSNKRISFNHLSFPLPILINSLTKPNYPPVVSCDLETKQLVSNNWKKYFPKGIRTLN